MQPENQYLAQVRTDFHTTDDQKVVSFPEPVYSLNIPKLIVLRDADPVKPHQFCPVNKLIRVHIGTGRAVEGMEMKIDFHSLKWPDQEYLKFLSCELRGVSY